MAHLTKRKVLSDLSGGWCRSYRFGVTIANYVLYMTGLDGGLIPDDEDSSNHYLVTLDLSSSLSVNDGSNYKMHYVNNTVPAVKYQALWESRDNSTLWMYGGLFVGNSTSDGVSTNDGIWQYSPGSQTWQMQQQTLTPHRLVHGGKANAPKIQAAYWVGGYQASDTTVSITDSTKNYASGMIQLNTTTGEYVALSAPFTPVQEGALAYIPVGEMGILLYVGGEVPSIQNGINATFTQNAWNYVQIYDIAGSKWYNQSTMGTTPSRTQFCASVQHDEGSSSYEVFILGGADFNSHDVVKDVSYLSIPSFKWYKASPLNTGRITLDCASYGSQIFGVGGRLAWSDDSGAGCYDMPAFIYDAQSQTVKAEFDPTNTTYSLTSSTYEDIKKSPYPSSWADPGLRNLFTVDQNSTSSTNSTASENDNSHSSNKGAIAGGVVGGLVGLALVIALIYYARQYARKKRVESKYLKPPPRTQIGELEDSIKRSELGTKTNTRTELDERFVERYELQENHVRRYELL